MLAIFNSQNSGGTTPPVDPIQDLVDEYKAYVTGLTGGEIGDETSVYNAISADVSSGLVTNTGVNTKSIVSVAFNWGRTIIAGKVDELISLYKIDGSFRSFKAPSEATRGQVEVDHLNLNWSAPTMGRLDTFFDLSYAKNSFFVEYTGHVYYVGGSSYFITAEPFNSNWRFATGTSQRGFLLTYNDDTSQVSAFTNNNYLINEPATYRIEFIRTGNTCTPKLYRNNVLFQTMADRTWDKDFVFSAVQQRRFVGVLDTTSIIKFQRHKIGLL